VEGAQTARQAGLRYVSDEQPGITRKSGRLGFTYVRPNGRPVRSPAELKRISALAIPPAWTDVWISPDPRGHVQATGRDARGRKQYRYHPRWRAHTDETKYSRLGEFAAALPKIHARVGRDLARPGLPREKVVAAVVQLLEKSLIRVGNDEYAKANGSFGLTTMRDRHVTINGATVHFEFRGKSGKRHRVDVNDRRLATIVKRCRDLPGQELFQYMNGDGRRQTIESADVNAYLKAATGRDFTAKDFRTWAGTTLAAEALRHLGPPRSKGEAERHVRDAVDAVAGLLGNTRTVCRASYIHPAVLAGYVRTGRVRMPFRRPGRARATRHKPA
jgi:DNA topoisomerase-1